MTRVTANVQNQTSNQHTSRPFNNTRQFKKSNANARGPLTSISTNQHRNRHGLNRNHSKSNPFQSFQPNKSGIISQYDINDDLNSDEPSDFSHFLGKDDVLNDNNKNNISNNSNSNSSGSNCVSSQSHSNQNVTITEDFISAALQRYNSMTVPLHHKSAANKTEHKEAKPKINNKYIFEHLPFDWSLKKSLYLISNEPFDWCSNIAMKIRNAALQNVSCESLHIDNKLQQKQYDLYQNMLYYQYPHNECSGLQLSIVHKFYMKNLKSLQPLQKYKARNNMESFANSAFEEDNIVSNFGESVYNKFVDRMCEWMQSFHSLYGLFRQRFTTYIYIHFASFFNIIFCYDAAETPLIVITNTHQSFRNNLKKQNIVFCTPLLQKEEDDKENEEMDINALQRSGIKVRQKRNANGTRTRYNNSDRTAVLIEGKINVHSFYDYLMNYMHLLCLSIKKCHDVPLLLCDKMFINAKCSSIAMTKNLSGFNENGQKMYTMQLNGYILPTVCPSIVKLLSCNKQNANISCQLHDKLCVGMNYCAKAKLFTKIKEEEGRNPTHISKIELNHQKKKQFTVNVQ